MGPCPEPLDPAKERKHAGSREACMIRGCLGQHRKSGFSEALVELVGALKVMRVRQSYPKHDAGAGGTPAFILLRTP